jgi:hypothetical protein
MGMLPYVVYEEVKPCDHAVILGGFYENPSAFKNATVFFTTKCVFGDKMKMYQVHEKGLTLSKEFWADLLPEFFSHTVDVTNLTPAEAAGRILDYIETYQP